MAKVVTLGEIMMRLSTTGFQRFAQASSMELCYGGAEANVAASLAQFGHQVAFVTKLPENALGDAAVKTLAGLGIDCSHIARGGNRLGIYFLEQGASVRPSSVIYDRAGSSFTEAVPSEFDFDEIFAGADLFHISGITPVLGQESGELARYAVKKAKEHGVKISMDLNYRAKLWNAGVEEKQKLLTELIFYADICFGNPLDAAKCLGYSVPEVDLLNCDYEVCVSEEQMKKMADAYHLEAVITTLRESISASDNGWSARIYTKEGLYTGSRYLLHIVDRVGGGDSFAAGCLHGFLKSMAPSDVLEFGIAAAAIKHTIPGDINYASEQEILQLMQNKGSGRVQR